MIDCALRKTCAPVAQRLEQQTHNLLVRGSNPCGGTKYPVSVLTFAPRELSVKVRQAGRSTYVSEIKVA